MQFNWINQSINHFDGIINWPYLYIQREQFQDSHHFVFVDVALKYLYLFIFIYIYNIWHKMHWQNPILASNKLKVCQKYPVLALQPVRISQKMESTFYTFLLHLQVLIPVVVAVNVDEDDNTRGYALMIRSQKMQQRPNAAQF